MIKYANQIVQEELSRREVAAGRPPYTGNIGISRAFDTWEIIDGQIHTIEPDQATEDVVAAEVIHAIDEIAKGNFTELDFDDSNDLHRTPEEDAAYWEAYDRGR